MPVRPVAGRDTGTEPKVQPRRERGRTQEASVRRRQLDRQGQPVELPDQRHDVGRVVGGQCEARTDEPNRPDVELHRVRRPGVGVGRGQGQGVDGQLLLAGQEQRPPRRRERGDTRARVEEGRDDLLGALDLLEVVQDEQQPSIGELLGEALAGRQRGRCVERVGHEAGHRVRVRHPVQRHEVDAVGEGALEPGRRGQRDPGLAAAARPGEGQQAGAAGEQLDDLAHLGLASDQRGAWRGQRGASAEAAQRREPGLEPRHDDVVEVGVAVDVLEAVPSEVAERHPRQGAPQVGYQPPRRLGQHDLAAVRRGTDPGSEVDVLTDVPLAVSLGLAGVQAHPDPQRLALRPRVCLQRALRRHRRPDRLVGR